MTEEQLMHGGIKESALRRLARKAVRPRDLHLGGAAPFDWKVGYDSALYTGSLSIKNQGQSDSCGGQAASRWVEIATRIQKGINTVQNSAKSVYSLVDFPGGGTTVGSIQNCLLKDGATSEFSVPSYENGQPPSEQFITSKEWQSDVNKVREAMTNAGWVAVPVNLDIESVAQAMRDTGAVIIEFAGKNNGTWFTEYPRVSTEVGWRHFVCAKSAVTGDFGKEIRFYNSWGENVGKTGVQAFTEDWFTSGRIEDVFTFVPQGVVNPVKITILQKLIMLYKALLASLARP